MKKMLTMLICVLLASAVFGAWEAVMGPVESESITDAIALDDNTFLKVKDNVVKKTTDMGATWTEILLPDGITVSKLDAVSATVAYLCANGGYVYKTENAGDTWTQIADTANYKVDLNVIDAYDANTVFIGGDDGFFMKTTDSGANWDTTTIVADDIDGGIAFVSATVGIALQDGNNATYWRTSDGGANWETLSFSWPLGTLSKRIYDAAAVPGTNTIVAVGYHNLIFISSDGGSTFSASGDLSYDYVYHTGVQAFSANDILVVNSASFILKTTDGGANWDTLSPGSAQSNQAFAFSSMNNGLLFGSYNQHFKTTDGSTFVPLNDWPGVSFWGLAFPSHSKVMLAAWGGGEISVSSDYGRTFTYPTNAATKTGENIYELHFINESTGLIAGGSGMVKKTTDGGETWVTIPTPMAELSNKHINMMHIAPDGTIFAGGSSGIVMRSDDDGETWTELPHTSTQIVYDMHVLSNGMALLGCGSGQFSVSATTALDSFVMVADYGTMSFRSIDERKGIVIVGASDAIWRTTVDNLDTLIKVFDEPDANDIYEVVFTGDSTVYAVGQDGIIYLSEDAGDSWTLESNPAQATESVLQNVGFNGYELWAVGQDGIVLKNEIQPRYQVTAHVNMSIQIRKGTFTHAGHNLDIIGSFNGWAAGVPMTDEDGDSVYSAVLGEFAEGTVMEFKCRRNGNWDNTEEFPYGGGNRTYTVLAEEDQDIPVFYYNDETEVAVAGIPVEFKLAQNYPNPFNPVTSINFDLPVGEMVSLDVYDVTGRKIAELLNKRMSAGHYKVKFDASMLPSGVYFYKLSAGDFVSIRKMTLLK